MKNNSPILQNALLLQNLEDPVLSQASTIAILNTDEKISQSIFVRLNNFSKNIKERAFVEIPNTFFSENELDFFYKFLTTYKGNAFVIMPDLSDIEPVIQAFDLLNHTLNLHVFHNSQAVCSEVLNSIISERNKNILNVSLSGTQAHLSAPEPSPFQKFDSYRLGHIYRDPEALIEPLKMTDLTVFDLSVVKQSDLPSRNYISVSGLSSETSNQIAYTAGMSMRNRIFIVTGLNKVREAGEIDADMFMQLFYYWQQGVFWQQPEAESKDEESNFIVDDVAGYDQINFYKSKKTGEWSVEFPLSLAEKYKNFKRIPCTYFDYEYTSTGDLSPRLYEIFMALNQYHEIIFPD